MSDEQAALADLGALPNRAVWLERQNYLPFSLLSDDAFEICCFILLLRERTSERIYYHGKTRDKGRDIVRHCADGTVEFIQCKRYKDTVGVREIRKELAKLFVNLFEDRLPQKPDRVTFYVVPDLSSEAQDLLSSPEEWRVIAPKSLMEHLRTNPPAEMLAFAQTWWPIFDWTTAAALSVRVEGHATLLDRFFAVKKVVEGSAADLRDIREHLRILSTGLANTAPLLMNTTLRAEGVDLALASMREVISQGLATQAKAFSPATLVPDPFAMIEEAQLFGGLDIRTFKPTRDEYTQGRVHRPAVADRVEDRLTRAGWALLRGRGAAGKTVLATLIALGVTNRGGIAYYLDLSDSDGEEPRIIDALSVLAYPGVLFVVDNVHLDEEFAARVFRHWKAVARGSRLLMLGRLVESGPSVFGGGAALAELDRENLTLEVTEEELTGIVRRLASRIVPSMVGVLESPPGVRTDWLRRFKGDLIAFSAAVMERIQHILRGQWELRPEDARHYVRVQYLRRRIARRTVPLPGPERDALLAVAQLATIELATPGVIIEQENLEEFLQHGVIHLEERARGRHAHYRLVHPGLGELLVAAEPRSVPSFEELAKRCPEFGFAIARQLASLSGKSELAAQLLRSLSQASAALITGLVGTEVRYIKANLVCLRQLRILTAAEADALLATAESPLVGVALQSPLSSVAGFLGYAEARLPAAFAAVAAALIDPANRSTLVGTALRTSLAQLTPFLRYAEVRLPAAHAALAEGLADPSNHKTLVETALRTPLHYVAAFMSYAETKFPLAHGAVAEGLADPANRSTLVGTALRTSLAQLTPFLRYAEVRLPAAHAALGEGLADPSNRPALTETAVRTSPDILASFLRYAEEALPVAHASLAAVLHDPTNHPALAESALGTSLQFVTHFMGYLEAKLPAVHAALAAALADSANRKSLVKTALRTPLGSLVSFLEYAEEALPAAHAALAEGLADSSNRPALAENALRTSLNEPAHFMRYAEARLPAVHAALAAALTDPANRPALAETGLRTPLNELAYFLEYAEKGFPEGHATLIEALLAPDRIAALAEVAASANPHEIISLYDHPQLSKALVAAIDSNRWHQNHARRQVDDVVFITRIGRYLRLYGRPELVEAPAKSILHTSKHRHWTSPNVTFSHLYHTFRSGRKEGPRVLIPFLEDVVGTSWIRTQYERTPVGILAGALFGIWTSQDESVIAKFRLPDLTRRVEAELRRAYSPNTPDFGATFQLIGSVALIGVEPIGHQRLLPESEGIRAGLSSYSVACSEENVNIEAQFWLGVREIARVYPAPLVVPWEVGESTLGRWQAVTAPNARLAAFNNWMLEWLDRSAGNDWSLIPDDVPFASRWAGSLFPVDD